MAPFHYAIRTDMLLPRTESRISGPPGMRPIPDLTIRGDRPQISEDIIAIIDAKANEILERMRAVMSTGMLELKQSLSEKQATEISSLDNRLKQAQERDKASRNAIVNLEAKAKSNYNEGCADGVRRALQCLDALESEVDGSDQTKARQEPQASMPRPSYQSPYSVKPASHLQTSGGGARKGTLPQGMSTVLSQQIKPAEQARKDPVPETPIREAAAQERPEIQDTIVSFRDLHASWAADGERTTNQRQYNVQGTGFAASGTQVEKSSSNFAPQKRFTQDGDREAPGPKRKKYEKVNTARSDDDFQPSIHSSDTSMLPADEVTDAHETERLEREILAHWTSRQAKDWLRTRTSEGKEFLRSVAAAARKKGETFESIVAAINSVIIRRLERDDSTPRHATTKDFVNFVKGAGVPFDIDEEYMTAWGLAIGPGGFLTDDPEDIYSA